MHKSIAAKLHTAQGFLVVLSIVDRVANIHVKMKSLPDKIELSLSLRHLTSCN